MVNFDLMHMIRLSFIPSMCCFVNKMSAFSALVAIAEANSHVIRVVKPESSKGESSQQIVVKTIRDLHDSSVQTLKFNPSLNIVVSTDKSGIVEVWDPETGDLPEDGRLGFEMLSETDLFSLQENATSAITSQFSPDGSILALFCRDGTLRLFSTHSGKILSTFSETIDRFKK